MITLAEHRENLTRMRERGTSNYEAFYTVEDVEQLLEEQLGTAPVPELPHTYRTNIDYDDNGGMRGWDVRSCSCSTPWRHE